MRRPGPLGQVAALTRLRWQLVRGPARRRVGLSVLLGVLLTALAVLGGAAAGEAMEEDARTETLLLMPTAYLVFLVATVIAAVASSGGRELLPEDQAVALPLSPVTDHLGALLLAPLNLAWLLQAVTMLAMMAMSVGWTAGVYAALATTALWLVAATALAQVVAWAVELMRTVPGGVWAVRAGAGALAALALWWSATDRLTDVLDAAPTLRFVLDAVLGADGRWGPWLGGLAELVALTAVAVGVGAGLAVVLSRRPRRDQGRVEARSYPPRADGGGRLLAVLRLDRGSVWRSTPLRRGLLVLALIPGASAAVARLEWQVLPMLPGLVASGAALLFGVNAFALDAGGALWRESLPAPASLWFAARATIIAEVAVAATVLALVVAASRAAGAPNGTEVVAVAVSVVVVTAQVLARSLHWSLRRPYRAELRAARDTPAPPAAMAWYSARLALTTTLMGLALSLTARSDSPALPVLVALPVLIFCIRRVAICHSAWNDPAVRARVVITVAGG